MGALAAPAGRAVRRSPARRAVCARGKLAAPSLVCPPLAPVETPAQRDSFATIMGARSLVQPTMCARARSGAQQDSSARVVSTARRLLARHQVFAHDEVALPPREDTRCLRASLSYLS